MDKKRKIIRKESFIKGIYPVYKLTYLIYEFIDDGGEKLSDFFTKEIDALAKKIF